MKRPTSRLRSGCSRTGAQMIWNRQTTGMRADFPVCPLPTEFARSDFVGEAGNALPFAPVEDDRFPPDNPKFNPPGIVPQKSQRYQEKSQGQRCYGNRTRLRSGAVGVGSVSGRHLVSLAERKCAEPGSRPRSISRSSVRRLRSERGARS